ncbi:nuclear transport factor 2 family protein [Pedobacter vanadiisoli]|uniref:Nuclear transport factor 2 family protein n=1 Tax=Pedobacter vanadiisoli TaxID=1761975 RepID=A0ABW5MEK6_9SPHI
MLKISLFTLALIISITCSTQAQHRYTPKDQALAKTILQQDSLLFDPFNCQDIKTLITFFSSHLEFYNDGGGMTGFQKTIENFKSLFERNKTSNLKRELEKQSFEVYPIPGYGAIALSNHRFLHTENGKQEIDEQKFIVTWQLKNNH